LHLPCLKIMKAAIHDQSYVTQLWQEAVGEMSLKKAEGVK